MTDEPLSESLAQFQTALAAETPMPADNQDTFRSDFAEDWDATEDHQAETPMVSGFEERTDPVPSEPVEVKVEEPDTPVSRLSDSDKAAAYQKFSKIMAVASYPPAQFESWLFPKPGSDGHLEGQIALARVISNLNSAGFDCHTLDLDPQVFPHYVQIGASCCARSDYQGGSVDEARDLLARVPAETIMRSIPKTQTEVVDLIAPPVEEPEIQPAASFVDGLAIATSCVAAILVPTVLIRNSSKL
jgi:hypothetical protein